MGAKLPHEGASPLRPAAGIPADEERRRLQLRQLGILDTAPEESFDRVTRLAAAILEVPFAQVSLIDEHRDWFKSRIGLEVTELPRHASFAAHAIGAREALVVPDATLDPRFSANPLVTGPPHVRAYLGVAFRTRDGQPIGALGAMDTRPRAFGAREVGIWSDFACLIQEAIHARGLAVESEWLLRAAEASERKHSQVEHRLQRIADSIPALIGYWNTALCCEFANDAYRAHSGLTPQQMIGRHIREVLGEELYEMNVPHARAALAGEPQRFQRQVVGADGRLRHTEAQYLPDRDANGEVRGFFVLVTDITELTAAKAALEASNAKLLKESTTDFLTGLVNRRVFSERIEAAAVRLRQAGEEYALVLLDLDDFKQINDRLGHEIGDKVLREVGAILREQLREPADVAARLGGEEFAILCPGNFTEESLFVLAARIRERINKSVVETAKGPVTFTSSFGIACSNTADASWKDIFARADSALYQAKEAGKDRIVFGRSAGKGSTGRFRSMGFPPAQ